MHRFFLTIGSAVSRLFLLPLVLMLPQLLQATSVEEVRMWQAPDHTRLVFDLSAAVNYELFTLSDPERVVIDIEGAEDSARLAGLDFTGSPVRGIRSGQRENDVLRIVLDLNVPVDPSSFTLAPNREFGDRLVVDLYDRDQVAPVPSVTRRLVLQQQERRDIVVAISAGHGGEDPGGIGYDGRIKEKNVTLALSRKLYNRLQNMPGYRPVLIRDGDYYVQLQQRPEIARKHRADLFVAIHADWFRSTRANGVTVYALSGDRADRENSRRVAEKENSSDLLGGVDGDITLGTFDDDVAMTLVSLQMAWSMEQSVIAGSHILQSLDGVSRLRRDKVQQASLQVLNSPDIPSILIETGYLSNPGDAERLNSPAFQTVMAAAMAQGIMNYFYETPPEGTLVAWQKENGIPPGTYTVKRGDSLSEIAEQFQVSSAELRRINQLSGDVIQIGQVLKLPGGEPIQISEHIIQRGETLSEIAERYRVSLNSLRRVNNLSGDRILVGQVLAIPAL